MRHLTFFSLLLALVLLACAGDEPAGDPQEILDAAVARLSAATHVQIDLAGETFPPDTPVLLSADGAAARPDVFLGDFRLQTGSIVTQYEVLSVGGQFAIRLPFGDEFIDADPQEFGFRDPALLLDDEDGILSLFDVATGLTHEDAERDDGEVLDTVSAQIPARAVSDLFFVADDAQDFTARLQVVRGSDEVRRVQIVGPFYDVDVDTAYVVRLTDYDEPFDVPPTSGG